MPAGTYVGRLKITDEAPDNQYTFTLMGDSTTTGEYLPSDFYLSNDTLRTSREFLYNDEKEIPLYIKVQDDLGNVYLEKFAISIIQNSIPSEISGNKEENVVVYPNPAPGKFYVEVPGTDRGNVVISLLDEQGRIIFNREYGSGNTIFELEYPYAGLYFIRVKPENGLPVLKKIVIY